MKKIFVKTNNVKNFIGLVENLQNKPKNIPKMGLVYGEPGLGKSQTALWLARKYNGIYLRCSNIMTSRVLLDDDAYTTAIYSLVGKGFGHNISRGGNFIMYQEVYNQLSELKAKKK